MVNVGKYTIHGWYGYLFLGSFDLRGVKNQPGCPTWGRPEHVPEASSVGCLSSERSIISVSSAHWMVANVEVPETETEPSWVGLSLKKSSFLTKTLERIVQVLVAVSIHPKHDKCLCRPTHHHHQAQSRWPSCKEHPGNVWTTAARKFHRRLRSKRRQATLGSLGIEGENTDLCLRGGQQTEDWKLRISNFHPWVKTTDDAILVGEKWFKKSGCYWYVKLLVTVWWWWWWWWWWRPHWYVYLHSIWGTFYGTCNWCKCR